MARRKQPSSPEALRRSGYGAHQSYIDTSVLRQIQAAMDHKRTLYGHSVQDTHGLFESIDTDHSGGLSELEVEKAFRRLDLGLSDGQISDFIGRLDKNHDGSISYDELLEALHGKAQGKKKKRVSRRKPSKKPPPLGSSSGESSTGTSSHPTQLGTRRVGAGRGAPKVQASRRPTESTHAPTTRLGARAARNKKVTKTKKKTTVPPRAASMRQEEGTLFMLNDCTSVDELEQYMTMNGHPSQIEPPTTSSRTRDSTNFDQKLKVLRYHENDEEDTYNAARQNYKRNQLDSCMMSSTESLPTLSEEEDARGNTHHRMPTNQSWSSSSSSLLSSGSSLTSSPNFSTSSGAWSLSSYSSGTKSRRKKKTKHKARRRKASPTYSSTSSTPSPALPPRPFPRGSHRYRRQDPHPKVQRKLENTLNSLFEEFKEGMKLDGVRHAHMMVDVDQLPLHQARAAALRPRLNSSSSSCSIDSLVSSPSPKLEPHTKKNENHILEDTINRNEQTHLNAAVSNTTGMYQPHQNTRNLYSTSTALTRLTSLYSAQENQKPQNMPYSLLQQHGENHHPSIQQQLQQGRGLPSEQYQPIVASRALTPLNRSRARVQPAKTPKPMPQLQKRIVKNKAVCFDLPRQDSQANNDSSPPQEVDCIEHPDMMLADFIVVLKNALNKVYSSFSRERGERLPLKTVERKLLGSAMYKTYSTYMIWDHADAVLASVILGRMFQASINTEVSIDELIDLAEVEPRSSLNEEAEEIKSALTGSPSNGARKQELETEKTTQVLQMVSNELMPAIPSRLSAPTSLSSKSPIARKGAETRNTPLTSPEDNLASVSDKAPEDRGNKTSHSLIVDRSIMRQIRAAMKHKRTLYGHTIKSTKTLFRNMDIDKSGTLTISEIQKAFHRLDLGLSQGQVSELIERIDKNHDGSISYIELVEALHGFEDTSTLQKSEMAQEQSSLSAGHLMSTNVTPVGKASIGTTMTPMQQRNTFSPDNEGESSQQERRSVTMEREFPEELQNSSDVNVVAPQDIAPVLQVPVRMIESAPENTTRSGPTTDYEGLGVHLSPRSASSGGSGEDVYENVATINSEGHTPTVGPTTDYEGLGPHLSPRSASSGGSGGDVYENVPGINMEGHTPTIGGTPEVSTRKSADVISVNTSPGSGGSVSTSSANVPGERIRSIDIQHIGNEGVVPAAPVSTIDGSDGRSGGMNGSEEGNTAFYQSFVRSPSPYDKNSFAGPGATASTTSPIPDFGTEQGTTLRQDAPVVRAAEVESPVAMQEEEQEAKLRQSAEKIAAQEEEAERQRKATTEALIAEEREARRRRAIIATEEEAAERLRASVIAEANAAKEEAKRILLAATAAEAAEKERLADIIAREERLKVAEEELRRKEVETHEAIKQEEAKKQLQRQETGPIVAVQVEEEEEGPPDIGETGNPLEQGNIILSVLADAQLAIIKGVFDRRSLSEDGAANLRGLLGGFWLNDEAHNLLDLQVDIREHHDGSTGRRITVLEVFERIVATGLKEITWEELMAHFAADRSLRERAMEWTKRQNWSHVSSQLSSHIEMERTARDSTIQMSAPSSPMMSVPPPAMSPPNFFSPTPAKKSRGPQLLNASEILSDDSDEDNPLQEQSTPQMKASPSPAKKALPRATVMPPQEDIVDPDHDHSSLGQTLSACEVALPGVTTDRMTSITTYADVLSRMAAGRRPEPKQHAANQESVFSSHIEQKPFVTTSKYDRPQDLIREISLERALPEISVDGVSQRREQSRAALTKMAEGYTSPFTHRPLTPHESQESPQSLIRSITNADNMVQSKLLESFGRNITTHEARVKPRRPNLSPTEANAAFVGFQRREETGVEPHRPPMFDVERTTGRAAARRPILSPTDTVFGSAFAQEDKPGNVVTRAQEDVSAAHQLLKTLQASLSRPAFSPAIQTAIPRRKADLLMAGDDYSTSSPSMGSPMGMALDSVTQSAQEMLLRVRSRDASMSNINDSPNFKYLKQSKQGGADLSMDASSLQARARELSSRIKAMKESRASSPTNFRQIGVSSTPANDTPALSSHEEEHHKVHFHRSGSVTVDM